jgi:UDP-N-acetylglucosamine 2-epimerase (non-hydrolysing)
LDNKDVYDRMSNAVNPYGDGTSSSKIYNIIKKYYDENSLNITSANDITDFKGYYMKHVPDDVTVKEYESLNRGHMIEQAFDNGSPMYIDDKLCLKDKDIIVRKFSIDN